MIIDCPTCASKVDAKSLANHTYGLTEDEDPGIYHFLQCPACKDIMLGRAHLLQTGPELWDYGKLTRLWPPREDAPRLHPSIPHLVRQSLAEGQSCYKAEAYSACAVMCGRAIEAICAHQKTKARNLAGGLKELKQKGVIDGRLSEWGDALRERRNIGAHASEENVSQEDAKDVLEFALAICEYVYVLSQRYEEFKERSLAGRSSRRAVAGAATAPAESQTLAFPPGI